MVGRSELWTVFIIPLIQAGNVYLCDLEILDSLPCARGAFCAAPLCLLYVDVVGQLKPIAIQLSQTPGEENPIFLPTDGWVDWIAAKMYYLNSHAQVIKKALPWAGWLGLCFL